MFEKWQFLRQVKRPLAFALAASLVLACAGPALAKRTLGTKGSDRIVGTVKADVIKGLGGNDRIKGRGGRDRVFGGRGRDRVSGGRGRDRVSGGRGRDRVSGGRGWDRLFGGRGRDRLSGGRAADRLNAVDGRRDRVVHGGPGQDVCTVNATDLVNVQGCESVEVAPGPAPGPAPSPGGELVCASPPEEPRLAAGHLARAAQEDQPPTFSEPFYTITITIDASADGLTGGELPISIEGVCDVPTELASEASQLIGGEGVGLISSQTTVFDVGGQQLTGDEATTALAEADTVSLRAQLVRPDVWRQNEEGQSVPTFEVRRADITD